MVRSPFGKQDLQAIGVFCKNFVVKNEFCGQISFWQTGFAYYWDFGTNCSPDFFDLGAFFCLGLELTTLAAAHFTSRAHFLESELQK